MTKQMNIPVLGIVENMSYYKCPDCGSVHYIFGKSKLDKEAAELNLDILGRIPVDPAISESADKGQIELIDVSYINTEKLFG
jgi:Mrp family chromosome partitioning ATPase